MRQATPRWASRLLWDSIALGSFQVPRYAVIIAFSGASGDGLVRGAFGASLMMLVLGRPYGGLPWVAFRFEQKDEATMRLLDLFWGFSHNAFCNTYIHHYAMIALKTAAKHLREVVDMLANNFFAA
jgi:hypothetical protein